MQIPETGGDWTGVALAAGIALALIAGLFLVQRVLRVWIRWRTGFSNPARSPAPRAEETLPLEENGLSEHAPDVVQ